MSDLKKVYEPDGVLLKTVSVLTLIIAWCIAAIGLAVFFLFCVVTVGVDKIRRYYDSFAIS